MLTTCYRRSDAEASLLSQFAIPRNPLPVPPKTKEPLFVGESDGVDVNHMELLIHLSLERDMFNLAVGVEDYHPSGLTLALTTSLKSPALMHQLLAFSSRHLAYKHPERSTFYSHQAVALQTSAITLFNAMYAASSFSIDQSNCVIILLFASVLGHHTLADALVLRSPGDIQTFAGHYVQCIETHRGIFTIAGVAWPMLMQSKLRPILSQSLAFTSREPEGRHCQRGLEVIESSRMLSEEGREACRAALRYIQVGLDAMGSEKEEGNRYQMICSWTLLVTPDFSSLLVAMQPEALMVLAHYGEMLHGGRHLWQIGDVGAHIVGIVAEHLGGDWSTCLAGPLQAVSAPYT